MFQYSCHNTTVIIVLLQQHCYNDTAQFFNHFVSVVKQIYLKYLAFPLASFPMRAIACCLQCSHHATYITLLGVLVMPSSISNLAWFCRACASILCAQTGLGGGHGTSDGGPAAAIDGALFLNGRTVRCARPGQLCGRQRCAGGLGRTPCGRRAAGRRCAVGRLGRWCAFSLLDTEFPSGAFTC